MVQEPTVAREHALPPDPITGARAGLPPRKRSGECRRAGTKFRIYYTRDLHVLHNACATGFCTRTRGSARAIRNHESRNDGPRFSRKVSRTLASREQTRRDTLHVSLPPFVPGDTRERGALAGKRETAASAARPRRSNVIRARARAACHARRASHRYYNIGQSAGYFRLSVKINAARAILIAGINRPGDRVAKSHRRRSRLIGPRPAILRHVSAPGEGPVPSLLHFHETVSLVSLPSLHPEGKGSAFKGSKVGPRAATCAIIARAARVSN